MSVSDIPQKPRLSGRHLTALGAFVLVALALTHPRFALETAQAVVQSLAHVAPLVVPGILLAAWITASGARDHVAAVFQGRTWQTILAATFVGALLPVCGVTVLPLMAGLLSGGVPLAPVMAFWLASPITGPTLLSATAATLGWEYAIGKTLAAIGLGLFGGTITTFVARRAWAIDPLRSNALVGSLSSGCDQGCSSGLGFDARIWRDPDRRSRFRRDIWSISRLMLLVLTPAFAAEHLLNAWLEPNAVAGYVGQDSAFAVPLAVLVGGPAYLDGFAALPLTRALLDHGMSPGAALAFLVSGGVVSVWGAMAIFPVLKLKPFLLYLALACTGSMLSGWIFGALV